MTEPTIVRATGPDAGWIADLIGGAFAHLGVARWLVPDPEQRAVILPRNFQIFVEYALTHGEVHTTADHSAAAVWLPQDREPLPPPEDYDERLARICGPWLSRFQTLDELFDRHHPEPPYQHLVFLAVHPDSQGAGRGSALLRHHHTHLDSTGTAAFLEASSTGSRDLYLRHGYTLTDESYAVPNGARFWPMWREPGR